MIEHKLNLNLSELTNEAITNGYGQKGFSDVKILQPMNELCWKSELRGELRLFKIKTFESTINKINTTKKNFFNISRADKFLFCQGCNKKLKFSSRFIRCLACERKYHPQLKNEKD